MTLDNRMETDDHEDLFDVFLDNRIAVLARSVSPDHGWKSCILSMISLLQDPEEQYREYYLREEKENKEGSMNDVAEDEKEKITSIDNQGLDKSKKIEYVAENIRQSDIKR